MPTEQTRGVGCTYCRWLLHRLHCSTEKQGQSQLQIIPCPALRVCFGMQSGDPLGSSRGTPGFSFPKFISLPQASGLYKLFAFPLRKQAKTPEDTEMKENKQLLSHWP